jgi:hypothetical protein
MLGEILSLDVTIHQEEKYGKRRRRRRETLEEAPVMLPFLFESRGVLDKSIFNTLYKTQYFKPKRFWYEVYRPTMPRTPCSANAHQSFQPPRCSHGPILYFILTPIADNSTSRYFKTPGTATIVVLSPPTHFPPCPSSHTIPSPPT